MPQKPTRLTAEELSLLFRGATPEGQFSGDPNAPNFSGPPEPEQQFTDHRAPNFGRPPPPPGLLAAIEEQKAFAGREEFLNRDAYRDTGTPSLFPGQRSIPDEVLNDPDFKRRAGPTLTGLIPPAAGSAAALAAAPAGPFFQALAYGGGATAGSVVKVAADEHILGIDPNDNNLMKDYWGSTGDAVADSAIEEIVFAGAPKVIGKAAGLVGRTKIAQLLAAQFSKGANRAEEFIKARNMLSFLTTGGAGENQHIGSMILSGLETLFRYDDVQAIRAANTGQLAVILNTVLGTPAKAIGHAGGQDVIGAIAKKRGAEVLGKGREAVKKLYKKAERPVLHPSNTIERKLMDGSVEIIEGPIDMGSVIGKLDVLRAEVQSGISSSTPLPAAHKKQLTDLLLLLDSMVSPKGILPGGQPDFRHGYRLVKRLRTALNEGIPDITNVYDRFNKEFAKILGEGLEAGFAKAGGNVEDLRAANSAYDKMDKMWSVANQRAVTNEVVHGVLPASRKEFMDAATSSTEQAGLFVDMMGGDKELLQSEILRDAFASSTKKSARVIKEELVQGALKDADILKGVVSGISDTSILPVKPGEVIASLKKNALYQSDEVFSPKKRGQIEDILNLVAESTPGVNEKLTNAVQMIGGRVFIYGTLATLGGLVGASGGEGYIDGGPIQRAAVGAGGLVVLGMGLDHFSSLLVDDQSAKFVRGLIDSPAKSAGTGRKIAGLLASKSGQAIRFSVSVVDPATKQVTPISIGEQAKRNTQGPDSIRLDPQDVDAMFSGTASGDNF